MTRHPEPPNNRNHQVTALHVLVWTVTLIASGIIAVVVVLTQIPFYEGLFGDHATPVPGLPALNLVVLTPTALESLAWVCTLMSVLAVVLDKPSGRYERLMWLFSLVAGLTNAVHNIGSGAALTGLILGGFSVAAPLLVHIALRWSREAKDERNRSEFQREALQRAARIAGQVGRAIARAARRLGQIVLHPIRTAKAAWLVTSVPLTWEQSYRVVYLRKQKTVSERLVSQFDLALTDADTSGDRGVHTPIETTTNDLEQGVQHTPEQGVQTNENEGVHEGVQRGVHTPAHPDPAQGVQSLHTPDWAHDLLREIDALCTSSDLGEQGVHDDHEQGVHTPDDPDLHTPVQHTPDTDLHTPDEQDVHTPAHPPATGNVHTPYEGVQHTPTKGGVQTSTTSSETGAVSARDIAAHHYWKLVHTQQDPDNMSQSAIARDLGVNRSAVNRGFKAARSGDYPDPGADSFK